MVVYHVTVSSTVAISLGSLQWLIFPPKSAVLRNYEQMLCFKVLTSISAFFQRLYLQFRTSQIFRSFERTKYKLRPILVWWTHPPSPTSSLSASLEIVIWASIFAFSSLYLGSFLAYKALLSLKLTIESEVLFIRMIGDESTWEQESNSNIMVRLRIGFVCWPEIMCG